MSDLKKSVGGIWIKTAKSGLQYYSLSVNGENYVAFQNKEKKSDKSPDWSIYKSEPLNRQPQEEIKPIERLNAQEAFGDIGF